MSTTAGPALPNTSYACAKGMSRDIAGDAQARCSRCYQVNLWALSHQLHAVRRPDELGLIGQHACGSGQIRWCRTQVC